MLIPEGTKYIPKFGNVYVPTRYHAGGRWPVLLTEDDSRLSVNLEDIPRTPSEIAIKSYSENEGVLEVLVGWGAVMPPHRYIRSGYVEIPICHMTSALCPRVSELK